MARPGAAEYKSDGASFASEGPLRALSFSTCGLGATEGGVNVQAQLPGEVVEVIAHAPHQLSIGARFRVFLRLEH
eukprot:CAMPEP_0119419866 /NCGR_PEP_ID=MMETSP1335-20130426/21983_1 /TAXON_ID=259385 /ORGANISM="Chrysoculter rhomboideus, Strain RCC1486" /LENGTH=74 /DNA_ID=CAMNT_0007445195 /DNA_START=33 /DNA_END=253 /DNA_ORIENTATION=+